MWIVGIVVCIHLILNYGVSIGRITETLYIDWNYTLIYPLLIIGGLLVVTLSKSELLKEITQWLGSRKVAQDLDKARRKRDASFVKCWKKGMSDEELAGEFNLKVQGVKVLKERLKAKRLRGIPPSPK